MENNKLIIKGEDKEKVIAFEKLIESVAVSIDGETVALFEDGGSFEFYGLGQEKRYQGYWNR